MKTAAGIAALAALGLVTVNYSSQEGSQLFMSERITEDEMAYMRYVTEFGKSYGTKAEFMFRHEQFKLNMAKIAEHESNAAHGSTVGLNEFSDWTVNEYKRLLGYKPQMKAAQVADEEQHDIPKINGEVNWVTSGAVTPVKNQGQCGSCWAFSTTGAVEGAMFISSGALQSYSEQQLVDCSTANNGCNGGLMDYAFQYIEGSPLMLEADYGYTGKEASCKYVRTKGVGKVKGFKDVGLDQSGNKLMQALDKGPVSVAIEADQFVFQGYTSGVITTGCGSSLDHGVLAVGYGVEGGQDYILVKNSWGPNWGDKGYVKIAPGQCGVTMSPSYPTE